MVLASGLPQGRGRRGQRARRRRVLGPPSLRGRCRRKSRLERSVSPTNNPAVQAGPADARSLSNRYRSLMLRASRILVLVALVVAAGRLSGQVAESRGI